MKAKLLGILMLLAVIVLVSCGEKGLKAAQESNPVDKIEALSNEVSSDGEEWTREMWDDAADLLDNALGNLPDKMTSDEETIVNSALSRMKVYAERHRRKASGLLEAIAKFNSEEAEDSTQKEDEEETKTTAQPAATPQPAPQAVAQPTPQPVAAPPVGLLSGSVIREGGYTNVRKGPGTNYAIVTKIKDGTPIYYTNYNANWCVVYNNAGNMLGYMHSSKVIPGGSTAPAKSKGLVYGTPYDWLSTRYVNQNDINKHYNELRILRNSIYARHGRKFKDAGLRQFFNSMPWYNGYRNEIPASELNKYEKYNIQFIQKYE